MKKNYTLLSLFVLPLLLTGCGDVDATKLPSKGTLITKEDGVKKLQSSIEAEAEESVQNDALGYEIEGGKTKVALNANLKDPITNTAMFTFASNLDASGALINFGVKGFTSTEADDIEMFVSAKEKIEGSSSITSTLLTGLSYESNYDGEYGFGLGYKESNIYLDLSNKQTYNMISDQFGSSDLGFDLSEFLPSNGKIKVAAPLFEEAQLPLVEQSDLEPLKENYQEFYDSLPEGGEFRDHGKGVYSYSGELTGADLEDELNEGQEAGSLSFSLDSEASFSYALIFSEKGLISFGIDTALKGSFSTKLTSGVTTFTGDSFDGFPNYQLDASIDVSTGFKFTFQTGSDVKFPKIDLSEYNEVTPEFNTDIQLPE